MRLQFQEKPWDLVVAGGYTLVMTAILLALGGGIIFAVLLVLFVPGYVLVAALFPKNGEIGWLERIALSFGLSIAVVPLLGLVLNFTPWGIRFVPAIITIALFTWGVGTAAYWRRMRLPPNDRLAARLDLEPPAWKEYSTRDKVTTVALTASVLIAASALTYIVLAPRSAEPSTDFYLLGPGGNATSYPIVLNVSQAGTVILGIANHESARVNYTIRIDIVGERLVYNSTTERNETVETNRTTQSWFNVSLAEGGNWIHPYTFAIQSAGVWKIQFLLFENGIFSVAYRELHFYVNVR